jgi:hypothetical protein
MFVNLSKYKSSDGSGRDTYIVHDGTVRDGKNRLDPTHYSSLERVNEFWIKADAKNQSIISKPRELTDTERRFLRVSARNKADSKTQTLRPSTYNNYTQNNRPATTGTTRGGNTMSLSMDSALLRRASDAQTRFGQFDNDYRIPV